MRYSYNDLKFTQKCGINGTNSGKNKKSNIEDGGKLKKSAKKFFALLEYAKNEKKSYLTTSYMTIAQEFHLNKRNKICVNKNYRKF
ncbi:MAG: hypothetical protein ISS29_06100 [Candidatus Marinimicrobia bacterium]|nr:hypothetical protein [Candidatus Neomarinimicrobiota bacterium]